MEVTNGCGYTVAQYPSIENWTILLNESVAYHTTKVMTYLGMLSIICVCHWIITTTVEDCHVEAFANKELNHIEESVCSGNMKCSSSIYVSLV